MYPATTSYFASYPVGAPNVIVQNFLKIETGKNCPYRGLIKCDILPPANILFPVIGFRTKGKLIFANCRTCAQTFSTLPCGHTHDQRKLHVTVTDVELTAALHRNYNVLKIYEVWDFEKWEVGSLFKPFNDKYTKIKMEASGWPEQNMTDKEKVCIQYLPSLNHFFKFTVKFHYRTYEPHRDYIEC